MASRIYPTREELSTVNCQISCSEQGCGKIFTSQSNLNLHLVKTHKREELPVKIAKEYYCPEIECIFNLEKCFKSLKLLKQHYLKVHCEKQFICSACKKGFPTLSSKNRHLKYCGVNFKCSECNAEYLSYETLLTHGRRKNHMVLEKAAYNPSATYSGSNLETNQQPILTKKAVYLLPKTCTILPLFNSASVIGENDLFSSLEKGSQTDIGTISPQLETKQTQVSHKRTNNIELRTRSSAETQTIGDYFTKKPKLSDSDNAICKKIEECLLHSVKTQTTLVSSKTQSSNTSFELSDFDLVPSEIVAKSSSSTQTNYPVPAELLYSISTATHDSIHTDTSDLNFEFMNSSSQTCFEDDPSLFNSNYFNCNTETQTDFLFDSSLLDYTGEPNSFDEELDSYCQKAYDDIIFNTIHTQTAFDDMARSVESQTIMSHTQTMNLACRDTMNMETQTDNEFKKLLEEINA